MRHLSIRRSAVVAALACGSLIGCNQHAPASESNVGNAYAELQTQLENCGSNALDCLKAANCDQTAEQACRDSFQACRDATRAAYKAFHDAVRECFDSARQCFADVKDSGVTGDAGTDAFGACRDQFKMCVQDNRPIRPEPGPCMAALRDCVQNDQNDKRDCFDQAHQCILDRLPMCGPANTDGGMSGGFQGGFGGFGHHFPGHGGPGTGGMQAPPPPPVDGGMAPPPPPPGGTGGTGM